jgi:selenocysteine-specific elongation factor
VEGLRGRETLTALGTAPTFISSSALRALEVRAREALVRFHRDQPLRAALPREELRERALAGAPAAAFELVLTSLERAGEIRLLPDAVALIGHAVRLSPQEDAARAALIEAARAAGLAGIELGEQAARGPATQAVLERVSRVLVSEHVLVRVGDQLVSREHLDDFKVRVRARYPAGSRLDVGAVKEMTGLTRRFVIPLLEYLDRERITRRVAGDRTVLG